jgi:hypothetical protein
MCTQESVTESSKEFLQNEAPHTIHYIVLTMRRFQLHAQSLSRTAVSRRVHLSDFSVGYICSWPSSRMPDSLSVTTECTVRG